MEPKQGEVASPLTESIKAILQTDVEVTFKTKGTTHRIILTKEQFLSLPFIDRPSY